ncbi:MAG: protein translocase subunit SecD [Terrimicrobiaceae bacterium]|nr:protein translocase subunit SecD [Terrimicrobiaceae bacterium]
MSPILVFAFGLLILVLFGWYFSTELPARRRWLGLVLTVLIVAFCIQQFVPPSQKIRLGLDLQGGTSFLLQLKSEPGSPEITKDLLDRAVEVIRKRVDSLGVSEPEIAPQGTDHILVQIAGISNEAMLQARDQLQRVAKLEFAIVHPGGDALLAQVASGQAIMPPGYVVKTVKDTGANGKTIEEKVLIPRKADFSGEHVSKAFSFFDQQGYGVSLEFDSVGAKLFDNLAAANVGNRLAIILDGEVISAPSLRTANFNGRAQITGHFSEKEARDLASALENPLRVPVQILETRSVSATLGADSIRSGVTACLSGLALVTVFMVVYYRLVGVIAIFALLVNCVMIVGALGMFHSVLTLPGIAGLILSLGIAVDANVLIYERLREELDAGKSLKAAVQASYNKAFSAIFDAHVTQFLTAGILYWLATGPVKGFALTLTIGIVASMFSSLLVTYTCFEWGFRFKLLDRVTMLHLIRSKGFNFLGHARPFIIGSTVLVLLSIAVFAYRGDRNFDADFKGGDLLVFSAKAGLTPDQVRAALAHTGLENSTIQAEHVADDDLISVRSEFGQAEKIQARLIEALPAAGLKFEQIDHIGPLIGKELAYKSGLALALGLLGIFIYVSFRFETSFAFGSLIALAHDLIITLGIFALSGRELSLIMVAALLTIAGYSINDKIVVFDRIRSGLRDRGSRSIAQVMNDSINDTLSRTILTGGTVLLTVLALYFFGGPVLNDFAFSFVVGVIVGTYSSIFIAAPTVLWWSRIRGKNIRSEVLDSEAARQGRATA